MGSRQGRTLGRVDKKMSFEIKKLRSDDFKLAAALFSYFQEEDEVKHPTTASDVYVTNLLARNDIHVIVADVDSDVVGGLLAYELPMFKQETSEMYLFELGVKKTHRRKGVATALIDALKEICREKKIGVMFLEAWADNTPALKLYERTGGEGKETVEFTYSLD